MGTADPVRKPAPITPRGGRPSLAAGVVLLLLALAALALADISGYPQAMGVAAVVLATIGALLLIVRLARRR